MALYKQAVLDKHVRKRKHGDQWLIGIFKGFEERVGHRKERSSMYKRQKVINDSVDQDAAQELMEENRLAASSWHAEQMAASSNQVLTGAMQVDIPEGLARNPKAVAAAEDDYIGDIQREVLTGLQRQNRIAAEEDFDDFQAAQAAKLAREATAAAS
eukprot:728217-Alexandrium_andersonii.AAC.1